MKHPKRRRATYPAVYSVTPFWVVLSISTALYLAIFAIFGMFIQKGLSL